MGGLILLGGLANRYYHRPVLVGSSTIMSMIELFSSINKSKAILQISSLIGLNNIPRHPVL
jgi:hypothetical protein